MLFYYYDVNIQKNINKSKLIDIKNTIFNMKSLSKRINESRELLIDEEQSKLKGEYEKYFNEILAKYNVKSPSQIPDEKKDDFFDEVNNGWVEGKGRK